MALKLNTLKCNHLTSLGLKGLSDTVWSSIHVQSCQNKQLPKAALVLRQKTHFTGPYVKREFTMLESKLFRLTKNYICDNLH